MLLMSVCAFAQSGNQPLKGDVNEDGKVDVSDIVAVVNIILNGGSTPQPAVTYYFSVGTTVPTASNYTSFNDATQEIPTEPFDFTNTSGRRTYVYILVPENKTVFVKDKNLGGTIMTVEYTDVSISNHKVYKTTAAIANGGTIVITLS